MRIQICLLFSCFGILPAVSIAQSSSSTQAAEKSFRDSIIKQELVARGFSADAEVHYRWEGDALVRNQSDVRTVGEIEASSVKLKGSRVEIKGTRRTLVKDSKGSLKLSADTPVLLVVELGNGSPETVLSQLKADLFYEDVNQALEDVPANYKTMIPMQTLAADKRSSDKKPSPRTEVPECPGDPALVTPPKLLQWVHPNLPPQDRQHGFEGSASLAFTVETTGRVSDIWLGVPADRAFNEAVIQSVRGATYSPAVCSGTPVSVPMQITIGMGFN